MPGRSPGQAQPADGRAFPVAHGSPNREEGGRLAGRPGPGRAEMDGTPQGGSFPWCGRGSPRGGQRGRPGPLSEMPPLCCVQPLCDQGSSGGDAYRLACPSSLSPLLGGVGAAGTRLMARACSRRKQLPRKVTFRKLVPKTVLPPGSIQDLGQREAGAHSPLVQSPPSADTVSRRQRRSSRPRPRLLWARLPEGTASPSHSLTGAHTLKTTQSFTRNLLDAGCREHKGE